jgi:DtxR family Mn-dependent transcriptional regulator
VKVLGLDWLVVHEEAEALEHALSDRVLDQIDALLDNPRVDPHGDSIPTPQGQLAEPRRISLADCPVGSPCASRGCWIKTRSSSNSSSGKASGPDPR